jgi:hypothetical protein
MMAVIAGWDEIGVADSASTELGMLVGVLLVVGRGLTRWS